MSDEAAIKQLLECEYPTHLNAGDVAAYQALYADDVLWAVPNMPDARSKDEIVRLVSKIVERVDQHVQIQLDDLTIDGDRALAFGVAIGTAARRPDGEPAPLALRVAWALARAGDGWLITRQVGTPKPAPT